MSDAASIAIAFIAIIPSTLAAVAAAWLSLKNGHKIEQVHRDVNSKMDTLVKVTGESERAKGNLEGRAAEKAKTD